MTPDSTGSAPPLVVTALVALARASTRTSRSQRNLTLSPTTPTRPAPRLPTAAPGGPSNTNTYAHNDAGAPTSTIDWRNKVSTTTCLTPPGALPARSLESGVATASFDWHAVGARGGDHPPVPPAHSSSRANIGACFKRPSFT